jgi:hypothetical protein
MRHPETKNRQGGAPKGERAMEKVRAAPCQRGTVCAFRRSAAPHWEAAKESQNPDAAGAAGTRLVVSKA